MTRFRIAPLLTALALITTDAGATQKGAAELLTKVDHLVYATPDLNRGVLERFELPGALSDSDIVDP